MKIKRILSTFLLLAVVFSSIVVAFPIAASAAYSSMGVTSGTTATADLNGEQLEAYLSDYVAYNYSTAEEMLKDELEAGYLYSVNSANNLYSLYVNKYTGFVFYQNNITGQILTSNPVDPGYLNDSGAIAVNGTVRQKLMSQIEIKFYESENATIPMTYNSYNESALRSQISVSPIANGLRVNYILGDTTPRFLLPGAITAEKFTENILTPLIAAYTSYLKEVCEGRVEEDFNFDFFENDEFVQYDDYGYINILDEDGLLDYVSSMNKVCLAVYDNKTSAKEYKALSEIGSAVTKMARGYSMENPEEYDSDSNEYKNLAKKYPIFGTGVAIYVCNLDNEDTAGRRQLGGYVKAYCPDYTFNSMYQDEKECGYVNENVQKPVFRCALEYSFNSDGSISVKLPASSITFDETVYTLEYIRPLQYFGCADAAESGYIFFPDGSGTIVDFKDFYRPGASTNPNLSMSASIYGLDYAYSNIDLKYAYRQQVSMPVYGIVNEVEANAVTNTLYGKETVTNGYFAILEEGSALATLWINSDFSSNKYGTTFASYSPYPQDTFDLSETTTGGATGIYNMVSTSKYTGSYVTRYVMLTDEEIGDSTYGEDAYYESSYVGMASYYKNYLKSNGTFATLDMVSEKLPLYVEALGAMDITAKILSFPVTKTVPLTTFEDVITMYNELSTAKDTALAKAAENEQLAAGTDDAALKASYTALAAEYRAFAETVENISNINFRLTGFANGGMKATYPTKARWERACGGSDGFEALVIESNRISETAGANFSVYPEFDFMYINNTAMFDGIGNKGNVSKMVDNRYASMQLYNSSLREFESLFDLVISSDVIDKLYTKFEKSFKESGSNKISVSTLGSALNSNFDEDNFITRDDARSDVVSLLQRMTATDGYELMLDAGNVYSLKYATHLLNVATDSSHFRYSSYTVPFTGLVLHSYVNYTGSPLNYSGNVQYEILKSIESGAAPYYILCYQNAANLKEDEELNDYYGVSYQNWYNEIVTTYAVLNNAIGGLQDYEIYDHNIIVCERVIEDEEMAKNYLALENEIVELLKEQLKVVVDKAYADLKAGGEENYAKRLKLEINRNDLVLQFSQILNLPLEELLGSEFIKSVDSIIAQYTSLYAGAENPENSYVVSFDAIEYSTKYSYITDSSAFDKDYVRTDYTIDNGNVTMVTYRKGADKVSFLINYNNFSVTVRLDADTVITLDKVSFVKLG